MSLYETISACRSCGSERLKTFLDLGTTPLADRLVRKENLEAPEHMVPLTTAFCEDCTLVQILETVDPEVLFREDYPYFSSVSPRLMKHFGDSARDIIERRGLGAESLVIEAASNDGYMLRTFAEAGIGVLGIDPAQGPAKVAQEAGIETLNTFFTVELAQQLKDEGKKADVFLGNNVLAHVKDLNGFVDGIDLLLADDGVAVIECPYLLELIDQREFDTIYHQHLCYFSVLALDGLFRRHGLFLNDVVLTDIHGGSLRLFVERKEAPTESVTSLLATERERGVDTLAFYQGFADAVETVKRDLMSRLVELKEQGATIVGYGAAAKACTLMAYCGIDRSHLMWVADLNERKHGRFMGGNHLEIVPPARVQKDQPDWCLILAWNFADEIMKHQEEYRLAGGGFLVPIPELRVVK